MDSPRVTSYGAMLLIALVIGWGWTRLRARGSGIDPRHVDVMAPLLVASGLAGAWAAGAALGEGRMLWGGLILAVAAAIGYCLLNRLKLGAIGDVFAPAIALSIGVGRVGCFMAGCCWGRVCVESPVAFHFPPGSFAFEQHAMAGLISPTATASLPVYPVQLMEAAGAAALAIVLAKASSRRRVPGELFLRLGIAYPGLRFLVEFLRADNTAVHGLTPSQWVCVVVALLCLAVGRVRRAMAGLIIRPMVLADREIV
jgi:phosphatidylglycerol:prolipoprotein diacylglycerol transferase